MSFETTNYKLKRSVTNDDVEQTIADVSSNFETIDSKMKEIDDRSSLSKSDIEGLTTRMTTAETKNTDQDTRLTSVEGRATTLEGRATTNETNTTTNANNLTTHKASSDHDSRYYPKADTDTKLAAKTDKLGDHLGTWHGLLPSQVNESITSQVQANTDQIGNLSKISKGRKSIDDYSDLVTGYGSGTEDWTQAWQTALQSGYTIVGESGKTYRITDTVLIEDLDVRITTSASEPFYISPSGSFEAFKFLANSVMTTTLSQDVLLNTTSITVQNTGLLQGQLISMKSNQLWYYDNRNSLYKGEVNLIRSVNANTIELTTPMWDTYKVATETVTINTYNPIVVDLENFEVIYDLPTDVVGISISIAVDPRIRKVKVKNARMTGISITSCYRALLDDIKVYSATYDTGGYGIQDNGSIFTYVKNGYFFNCRRGVDFSGGTPSRGGAVFDSIAVGTSDISQASGFGTHGTAEHILFVNNTVENMANGFVLRGANITALNNRLIGKIDYGFVAHYGTNFSIIGNQYNSNVVNKDVNGSPDNALINQMNTFVQFDSNVLTGDFIVTDNVAESLEKSFIQIGNQYSNYFSNLIAKRNKVNLRPAAGATDVYFLYHGFAGTTLKNSDIRDNDISFTSGVYSMAESVMTIELNTCFFDNMIVSSLLTLEKWGGTGNLANITLDLKSTKHNDTTMVTGYLKFDIVTGNTAIRLSGLPNKVVNDEPAWLYIDALYRQGVLKFIPTDHTRIYIGYATDNYNGQFPVGTGYKIPINIFYKTR